MITEAPRHVSRTLPKGEIVYLVNPPERGWMFSLYECRQQLAATSKGLFFVSHESFLPQWREREFPSVDEAVAFIAAQINAGRLTGN